MYCRRLGHDLRAHLDACRLTAEGILVKQPGFWGKKARSQFQAARATRRHLDRVHRIAVVWPGRASGFGSARSPFPRSSAVVPFDVEVALRRHGAS
jgi:hypothetical protein